MMSNSRRQAQQLDLRVLRRKDVLAGLLFVAVAVFGLWASRNYPIGTALRMGTGYVPRLLCWLLLGLGVVVFINGLLAGDERAAFAGARHWRALVFVPGSLVVFAFAIERLGVVIATVLLVGVGSLAGRDIRPLEVIGAAVVLVFLTLAIFIWGLELPIPVWPEQ
jgi:putative tricarboxylic transport membrane protein